MVDITVSSSSNEEPAESSREGLRRMQRLNEASNPGHKRFNAAFHPLSSALIYPPTASTGKHHLLTSVFAPTTPRTLPFPPVFASEQTVTISPDGSWFTAFHGNPPAGLGLAGTEGGGQLFVYSASLLDPSSTAGSFLPPASFSLPSPPLAILHLYPPRTRLSGDRTAPPLGPAPPPTHAVARDHGPTLIVLTAELVYFFHPHPLPAPVVLDTRGGPASPELSVSAAGVGSSNRSNLSWTINALRCPLGSRSYADLNNPGPLASAYRARRGWLSLVPGSEGIWAALERNGDVSVVRIDIGLDDHSSPYMTTTPMPSLPRTRAPAFTDGEGQPRAELEEVAFIPLADEVSNVNGSGAINGSSRSSGKDKGVGVVFIYRDWDETVPSQLPTRARTRFDLCELHYRQMTIVDGFDEIGSGGRSSTPMDWFPSMATRTTSLSPEGTTVLSLTQLPDIPPYTLAIALMSSPSGLFITHLNLVPQSAGQVDRWSALVGEEIPLHSELGLDGLSLLPSQGVRRGEVGLVALIGTAPLRIIPGPRADAPASPTESVRQTAERAARSIALAIAQGVDWSDVVRAAFATISKDETGELATMILDQALGLFIRHSKSYVRHVLRLQVAVWDLAKDSRKSLAAELIRIGEASQIFTLCANEQNGVISFDVDSMWSLVDVFEWSLAVVGQTLRDAITDRAQSEWTPSEPHTEGSSRVLYLVHPLLRRLLVRLITLLEAFAKFVINLDRPVLPANSAFIPTRNPRATTVAAHRVSDAISREGVDLATWSEVLNVLSKSQRPSDADTCASLLALNVAPLHSILASALSVLPTPSTLFVNEPLSCEWDGATFAPMSDRPTARCDRCHARTVLALHNVMRGEVPTPWAAWRRTWVTGCVCGGTWIRERINRETR